jgi:hypothetical protein
MASTGKVLPGTAASVATGDIPWADPDFAKAVGSGEATTFGNVFDSEFLQLTNFGLNVPGDATIDGVICWYFVYQNALGHVNMKTFSLIKGGTRQGDNKGSAGQTLLFDFNAAEESEGGAADLWSLALSPADVNASNFGFAMQVHDSGGIEDGIAFADYGKIEVIHHGGTELPGPTVKPYYGRFPKVKMRRTR